jgi:hypothetical protein
MGQMAVVVVVVVEGDADLAHKWLAHVTRFADSRSLRMAGSNNAINTVTMAITTSSSMSVNARRSWRLSECESMNHPDEGSKRARITYPASQFFMRT